MFCWLRQFQISSALEDRRDLSPRLLRHAARCHRCGYFLAASRRLDTLLADQSAPANLGTATPRLRFPWRPALAAAAAILLAFLALPLWHRLAAPTRPLPADPDRLAAQPNALENLAATLTFPSRLAATTSIILDDMAAQSFALQLDSASQNLTALAYTLTSYLPRLPQQTPPPHDG